MAAIFRSRLSAAGGVPVLAGNEMWGKGVGVHLGLVSQSFDILAHLTASPTLACWIL